MLQDGVGRTALQPRSKPLEPPRADDDGRHVSLAGQADDRIGHVGLVRHGERLGLEPGRSRQLGPVLRGATGASVKLVLDLLRLLDVDRNRGHLHAGGRERGHVIRESRLPHGHHQRPA